MIETLVLDAEGVVIDTERVWDLANKVFFETHGVTYVRAEVKHLLSGRTLVESSDLLKKMYGLAGDPASLARERHEEVKQLLAEHAAFLPGFRDFFQVHGRRLRCCIATALDPDLLAVVDERLHLRDLFDGNVFTVADAGRSKPHPDVFLYASSMMGSSPTDCLVVEDSPNGIEAARRAGMCCIALASTYSPSLLTGADYLAHSWADVSALLPNLSQCAKGRGNSI